CHQTARASPPVLQSRPSSGGSDRAQSGPGDAQQHVSAPPLHLLPKSLHGLPALAPFAETAPEPRHLPRSKLAFLISRDRKIFSTTGHSTYFRCVILPWCI